MTLWSLDIEYIRRIFRVYFTIIKTSASCLVNVVDNFWHVWMELIQTNIPVSLRWPWAQHHEAFLSCSHHPHTPPRPGDLLLLDSEQQSLHRTSGHREARGLDRWVSSVHDAIMIMASSSHFSSRDLGGRVPQGRRLWQVMIGCGKNIYTAWNVATRWSRLHTLKWQRQGATIQMQLNIVKVAQNFVRLWCYC